MSWCKTCREFMLYPEHCYAEAHAARFAPGHWGDSGRRRFFGDRHWAEPLKWDRRATRLGERHRVFCASMADVFEQLGDGFRGHPDAYAMTEARSRLFKLIEGTDALDWLLLTKRPENIMRMVPRHWRDLEFPHNVWIGTTVEDQETAEERLPHLLKVPARVRFLSCEPLLGPVDLRNVVIGVHGQPGTYGEWAGTECCEPVFVDALTGTEKCGCAEEPAGDSIDWVVVGGESGPHARPMHLSWARSLVQQCKAADVPVLVKQLGAKPVTQPKGRDPGARLVKLRSRKGSDMSEWPTDLRVREFPEVSHG